MQWVISMLVFFSWRIVMISTKEYTAVELNRIRIRNLYRNNLLTRPSTKNNQTIVAIGLGIIEVAGIDPRTQVITLNANFEVRWCDDTLKWDSNELLCLNNRRNRSKLFFHARDIWTPDIVAINGPGKSAGEVVKYRYPVLVLCSGDVRWPYQEKLYSFCEIDVRNFPFDRQYCSILFQSSIFDSSQFKLRSLYKFVRLYNFIDTEWTITHATIEELDLYNPHHGRHFSTIKIQIELVRLSRFYIIKIIIPFSIISSLALFSFCVPTDSGEKVTLTVSVLLSLTIYLQMISEYVPKTERGLCTLTLLSHVTFMFVFFSCVCNIFTVFTYYHEVYTLRNQAPKRDKERVLHTLHQSLTELNRQRCSLSRKSAHHPRNSTVQNEMVAMELFRDLRYVRKLLFNYLLRHDPSDLRFHLFHPHQSLKRIALLIDRILFFIYLLSMPLSILIILLKSDDPSRLSPTTNQLYDLRRATTEPMPLFRSCPK